MCSRNHTEPSPILLSFLFMHMSHTITSMLSNSSMHLSSCFWSGLAILGFTYLFFFVETNLNCFSMFAFGTGLLRIGKVLVRSILLKLLSTIIAAFRCCSHLSASTLAHFDISSSIFLQVVNNLVLIELISDVFS